MISKPQGDCLSYQLPVQKDCTICQFFSHNKINYDFKIKFDPFFKKQHSMYFELEKSSFAKIFTTPPPNNGLEPFCLSDLNIAVTCLILFGKTTIIIRTAGICFLSSKRY